jgi:hypothetical protein
MDVRHGEGMIMMVLFGLLEREEGREAMDRMMVEAVRRGWGGLGLTQPRGRGIHGLHRDAGNLAKHRVLWR